MQLNRHFDLRRFLLLLRLELYRSRKGLGMTLVIAFGMLFFVGFLLGTAVESDLEVYDHNETYAFNLFIGGFILSSLAFNDLSSPLRRYHFLTLPVSALERFLSMWLLSSIGWVVVYSLLFTAYAYISNPIGSLIFGRVKFLDFNPFGAIPLTCIHYYLVLQGIFLAGAAHFKGYAFPKTLFTLILLALSCGTIGYLIMGDYITDDAEICLGKDAGFLDGTMAHRLWSAMVWLFWWVLTPLSWLIAYLGLKEQEA